MGEKTHGGSKANLLGRNPRPEMVDLFSNEKQVTDKTPPMFLAHAKDDTLVAPDNSRMLYEALKAHKVAAEYLELPSGGHGLNGYKGPMWDAWQTKSLEWLAVQKLSDRRDGSSGPARGQEDRDPDGRRGRSERQADPGPRDASGKAVQKRAKENHSQ